MFLYVFEVCVPQILYMKDILPSCHTCLICNVEIKQNCTKMIYL